MSIVKISDLPAADSPVSPSDVAPVVQNGVTKKAAIDQLGFLPAGANVVTRTIQDKLREFVSVKDFGAVGDGITNDTVALQTAINYCIANRKNIYIPTGTYLIYQSLKFIDTDYPPDYPFPRLDQHILFGESGSKIKAAPGFSGTMLLMGENNAPQYVGWLMLEGLTIDGNNQEITLVGGAAGLGYQSKFSATSCNFLGVTGANSIALDGLYASIQLSECIVQGSGGHTTNGIGIRAKYTHIRLDNCMVSYFGKAIYFTNFAETTVQAKNCLFQINAASLAYEGGAYINNTSSFIGCYFVEHKPNDVHFLVEDQVTFGSWGNLNFYSCQFDNYNANAGVPLFDLDFGNCGANMTFVGCNAWVATAPPGTFPLKQIEIGQYTTAYFNNCTNFDVVDNNNPPYAKFAETKPTGEQGGTSISGFNERILNTTGFNKISGCSLDSNIITLPKGVYRVQASAPCSQGNRHRLILVNNTKNENTILGSNCYTGSTDATVTTATLSGRFAIDEECEFRLLHYIETGQLTTGLGAAIFDNNPEVYAEIEIWKEA